MKLHKLIAAAFCALVLTWLLSTTLQAATAEELNRDAGHALHELFIKNPKARQIANESSAMLVFPTVVKAGFIFGAQGGEGVLIRNGRVAGYYRTTAVSYGLQAGVQKYGYVLFFMNHQALSYLHKSDGWEIGVGPSIVVVDTGMAKSMSSTTLQDGDLCLHLQSKRVDGGTRFAGREDHPIYAGRVGFIFLRSAFPQQRRDHRHCIFRYDQSPRE